MKFKKTIFYLPILIFFLTFTSILFFSNNMELTAFAVREETEIKTPKIENNKEIEEKGYKFSNTSGIIISTPSYMSCSWKPPEEDDGYKICEAIFEIEGNNKEKTEIRNPKVDLDFEKSDEVKNVRILYSKDFKIKDEIYREVEVKEEDLRGTKKEQDQVRFTSSSESLAQARDSEESKRKKTTLETKKEVIKKRDFENFFELSEDPKVEVKNKNITEIKSKEVSSNKIGKEVLPENKTLQNKTTKEEIEETNSSENKTTKKENNSTRETELIELEEENKTTINKNNPEENPTKESTIGLITGLVTSSFRENNNLNSKDPFAVKVIFEIPKYEENSFDFKITDEEFNAKIDPDISGCGNLTSENSVYTLTDNINSSATCFTISANNVTLDCNNYNITYSTSSQGYGIYSSYNETKINNCNIYDGSGGSSGSAIFLLNSHNSNISNNNIEISSQFGLGIQLDTSKNSILSNNNLNISGGDNKVIYLSSSSTGINISKNNLSLTGVGGQGIFLSDNSDSSIILNNNITMFSGEGYAIFLDSSRYHNISKNNILTFEYESYGIYSEFSSNSSIEENTIETKETDSTAVFLVSDSFTKIKDNLVNTTGYNAMGIDIEESSKENITNNTIYTYGEGGHGIYVFSNSEYSYLEKNKITTSGESSHGIVFRTESNYGSLKNSNITTTGDTSSGIHLRDSSDLTIQNIKIDTFNQDSYGVNFDESMSRVRLSDMRITTNDTSSYPIYLHRQSPFFEFQNSSISALSGTNHFYVNSLVNGGEWNLTNSSPSKVDWEAGAIGTLRVKEYIKIKTNYTNGSLAKNINITIQDKNNTLILSSNTNENATILVLLENYTKTSNSSKTFHSNYTINASTPSENISKELNLSESKIVVLTFESSQNLQSQESESSSESSPGGTGGVNSAFCYAEWECSSWGACENGTKTRECVNNRPSCTLGQIPETNTTCRKETLFDVKVDLLDNNLDQGDKILTKISLLNIGLPGRVNANLYYEIKDENNNIIYSEEETVEVETQMEFVKEFTNLNLKEGEYTIFVDLSYDGQIEPASSIGNFRIGSKKSLYYILNRILLYSTLFISLLVFGLLVLKYLQMQKQRSKKTPISPPNHQNIIKKDEYKLQNGTSL